MRIFFTAVFLQFAFTFSYSADTKDILSPNGKIKVSVEISNALRYVVFYENKIVLNASVINLTLGDGSSLSGKIAVNKLMRRFNNSVILSQVPEKRKNIPDLYNELTIRFKKPISVVFRVYDDGVAYRFLTHFDDSIIVREETAEFNFPANHPVYFSQVVKRENADIFHTSFEEPYEYRNLDSLTTKNLCFTPTLIAAPAGPKILITESDLEEYPGMFLSGNSNYSLKGIFAAYPLEEKETEGSSPSLS